MRHRVTGRKMGRDINARKALLKNLASSLFEKGNLTTTLVKAKFARPHVEKLLTVAKKYKLGTTRHLASELSSKAFSRLTSEIAPGMSNRIGGYTRIVKLARRRGDSAPMARLELLEWKAPKKVIDSKSKTKKLQPKVNKKQITKATKK